MKGPSLRESVIWPQWFQSLVTVLHQALRWWPLFCWKGGWAFNWAATGMSEYLAWTSILGRKRLSRCGQALFSYGWEKKVGNDSLSLNPDCCLHLLPLYVRTPGSDTSGHYRTSILSSPVWPMLSYYWLWLAFGFIGHEASRHGLRPVISSASPYWDALV